MKKNVSIYVPKFKRYVDDAQLKRIINSGSLVYYTDTKELAFIDKTSDDVINLTPKSLSYGTPATEIIEFTFGNTPLKTTTEVLEFTDGTMSMINPLPVDYVPGTQFQFDCYSPKIEPSMPNRKIDYFKVKDVKFFNSSDAEVQHPILKEYFLSSAKFIKFLGLSSRVVGPNQYNYGFKIEVFLPFEVYQGLNDDNIKLQVFGDFNFGDFA